LAKEGGRTEDILEWGNSPPAVCVRLNRSRTKGRPLSEEEAGRFFRGCRRFAEGGVDGTYRIEPEGAPGELPGFKEGLFTIQDETQVRPARLLAPPAGSRVLDLCAGLGTKTTQLAELVGPAGEVVALDTDARKLKKARAAAKRLGLENIRLVRGDALDPPPEARAAFDYVLVDAPCSNLGALDRRPEVRFRLTEEALGGLAEREAALLRAGLSRLAPGGVLVYSVCSFEPEESGEVVAASAEGAPDLAVEREEWVLPAAGLRDGGYSARIAKTGGKAP
jgi:16S rRNA (cytosine967-C5)-methyltransferase